MTSKLYLIDQPARARSAWLAGIDGNQSTFDVKFIESHFTSTQRYNLWPQAHLHSQWPGNGSAGDKTFDQFYKSSHPSLISDLEQSDLMKTAGSQLIDTIGVSHYLIYALLPLLLADNLLQRTGRHLDGSFSIWTVRLDSWRCKPIKCERNHCAGTHRTALP